MVSLHLAAVHVELFEQGAELVSVEAFTGRVLSDIADDLAIWAIGNNAIEGTPEKRESLVTANIDESNTLRQDMARLSFRVMGGQAYWLPFGEFDYIHGETGNDIFSPDVERFIKYAKDRAKGDMFEDYITFIAVYELHTFTTYGYEGDKDVDHEWYFVGFLDDLTKLRGIVRQQTGDPCAACEGSGRKRPPMKMPNGELEKCTVCGGSGELP